MRKVNIKRIKNKKMDWNILIPALLSALVAGGGIGGFFQVKENKRAKKIENDKAAADEWKELYEKSEAKCTALGEKLDSVYGLFREEQEKRQGVEVSLARAEMCRCDKLKCGDREPPFGANKTA